MLQKAIYYNGTYNDIKNMTGQRCEGLYKAEGLDETFMDSYLILKNLSNLSVVDNTSNNNFLMISNDTTHSPCLLKVPEYEPAESIDNTEYENEHKDRFILNGRELKMTGLTGVMHYQINVAAMIQLGNFFDYLRENDVYDNTKIILIADHGAAFGQFDDMIYEDVGDGLDAMYFNPLLMVKDFNSKDFTTDNSFMTQADVPVMAFKDLVDNPVNPATGKVINDEEKYNHDQYIINSQEWMLDNNHGNTFVPAPWYSVHDNIFDKNNWKALPVE